LDIKYHKSRYCLCKICNKKIGRNHAERHWQNEHKEEYSEKHKEIGFGAVGLRGEPRWLMFAEPLPGEVA